MPKVEFGRNKGMIRYILSKCSLYSKRAIVSLEQYDVVMITKDMPEEGLSKWQVGTILGIYDRNHFEVEISDHFGNTLFLGALSGDLLELIWSQETKTYVGRFNGILNIINNVKSMIESKKTNIIWTKFNSSYEIITELDKIADDLVKGKIGTIEKLRILFAPTGELQEISIDNDWGDEFIKLAEHFDVLVY